MTRSLRLLAHSSLACGLVLVTAACGSSGGSGSLAGPSPLAPSGATVQGVVNPAASGTSSLRTAALSGLRVSVVGTALATQTDPSGRFVLQGVPGGSAALRFEGPGIDARLSLSGLAEGQVLEIEVQVSGSRATITSGSDRASNPSPRTGGIEFGGVVESVGSTSLVVAGRTVGVDAVTEITRGNQRITLGDVGVGETAKVEGAEQPDGSVLARQIKLGVPAGGVDGDTEFELTGTIDAISAPSLTVDGVVILTDAQTSILRGRTPIALTDLQPGETVEVKGDTLAGGTRLASRVKAEDESGDDNGGQGGDDGSGDDNGGNGGDDGGGDDNGGHGGDDGTGDDNGGGNSGSGGNGGGGH